MELNIFNTVQLYAGSYTVDSERAFTPTEIAACSKAEVVLGDYSISVRFHLKSGESAYIPIDTTCQAAVGQIIDLTKCKVIKLSRGGNDTITRIFIGE